MKQTLFLVAFFLTLNSFGQKLTEKVGDVELQMIGHYYKINSDGELTKKKSNRKNRPHLKMYFDSKGALLKSTSFGKHHNLDLKLLDRISIYHYDTNGIRSKIDIWETDYEKNLSHKFYKTFDLDSTKSKIVSEKIHHFESDSIFTRTDYWYDEKGRYQGVILDSTYFYKREYNEEDKVINLQQIHDSKVRWEWKFTFSDKQREGIFQTYYNDGEDYSKKKLRTYNDQGFPIVIEEIRLSKNKLIEKTQLYYDKNGVISLIEHYKSFSEEEGYELASFIEVKVKNRIRFDSQIAERINKEIFSE